MRSKHVPVHRPRDAGRPLDIWQVEDATQDRRDGLKVQNSEKEWKAEIAAMGTYSFNESCVHHALR